jgi:hypothetical protein
MKVSKLLYMLIVGFLLNSCVSSKFTIAARMDENANDNEPITVLVEQPALKEDFNTIDYNSLVQKSLSDEIQLYSLDPRQGYVTISQEVDDTPLAVYFIMKKPPTSTWKFYVEHPLKDDLNISIDDSDISKDK